MENKEPRIICRKALHAAMALTNAERTEFGFLLTYKVLADLKNDIHDIGQKLIARGYKYIFLEAYGPYGLEATSLRIIDFEGNPIKEVTFKRTKKKMTFFLESEQIWQ